MNEAGLAIVLLPRWIGPAPMNFSEIHSNIWNNFPFMNFCSCMLLLFSSIWVYRHLQALHE